MITRYFLNTLQYIQKDDRFDHRCYEFDPSDYKKLDYDSGSASVTFVVSHSKSPYDLQTLYSNWHLRYPYLIYPKQKSMIEGLAI